MSIGKAFLRNEDLNWLLFGGIGSVERKGDVGSCKWGIRHVQSWQRGSRVAYVFISFTTTNSDYFPTYTCTTSSLHYPNLFCSWVRIMSSGDKKIFSLSLMYLVTEHQRTGSKASERERFIQIFRHTSFFCASLYWFFFFFNKLELCGNPALSRSVSTNFSNRLRW